MINDNGPFVLLCQEDQEAKCL